MKVKQIIIQGFKSYKDQTVIDPFSPKCNVIVGRNGSGKSNFFAAIRFVLGDAYNNMSREERQALLHEGTGPATMSAYVEIIFDNSDNRFPTGKEEVSLRRTIGLKKDEYSLDKKSVPKSEVMSLLESAGFSRSNPYYIVPQGRITSLCNAKDSERLHLLKEVAGTRVYEQRRQESLKIMEETDLKRQKINELLQYIEERMNELEEEKEELRIYNDADKTRRCLEYTIYQREQNDIHNQLEELENDHLMETEGSHQRRIQIADRERLIADMENELKTLKQTLDVQQAERQQLQAERDELVKQCARLEMLVCDSEESSKSSKVERKALDRELERVEKEISKKEKELVALYPQYESITDRDRLLREEYEQLTQKQEILSSKQGRVARFKSRRERDDYLKQELKSVKTTLEDLKTQQEKLNGDISLSEENLSGREAGAQTLQKQLDSHRSQLESINSSWSSVKQARDGQYEKRKDLWRQDAQLDAMIASQREEYRKANQLLFSTMDKSTSAGLAAVRRIVDHYKIPGFYGALYELFEVDSVYATAVEVTAGSSLFHVLVDTDDTAAAILEHLNREKGGRVTFMPLNRLQPHPVPYPNAKDALPMIEKLRFDQRYRRAFEQVFGKTLICPNLETAFSYAKSHKLNAITLEGDRVERKGSLSGGFMDARRSRLDAVKQLKAAELRLGQEETRSKQIKSSLESIDRELNRLHKELSELENNRSRLLGNREPIVDELASSIREIDSIKSLLQSQRQNSASLESSIRTLELQTKELEQELASDMQKTLSAAETAELDRIRTRSDAIKKELAEITLSRTKIESEKTMFETDLKSNLCRKRSELRKRLEEQEFSADVNVTGTSDQRAEFDRTVQEMTHIDARLKVLEKSLDELKQKSRDSENLLSSTRTDHQEDKRSVDELQRSVERYLSKRSLLMQKREERAQKIRELGALPEGAFESYQSYSSKKLVKELHKVNEQLKKYGHVNKKAFEQHNSFSKQRESLNKRKSELDTSAQSIQDLIQVLDQRKDEAIERTFEQVSKNFAAVFKRLVPSGEGELMMQRRIDEDAADDSMETTATDGNNGLTDSYTGVGIRVSFHGDDSVLMQQLSGGQKSLVALALIFAIQQCDPAPFYLFDEIDANLDAAYRTAVATMVSELSEEAQFIVTTFRPEMLRYADKFYGVTFQDRVSRVNSIRREDAMGFVDQEAH